MQYEFYVEWDSCDSGCGDTFFYFDDPDIAVTEIGEELSGVCHLGDTIEAFVEDSDTMHTCAITATPTGYSATPWE